MTDREKEIMQVMSRYNTGLTDSEKAMVVKRVCQRLDAENSPVQTVSFGAEMAGQNTFARSEKWALAFAAMKRFAPHITAEEFDIYYSKTFA